MIIGANVKSVEIIKSAFKGEIDYSPLALVSDNEDIMGTYFSSIPVYSKFSIEKVVEELEIDTVMIVEQTTQKEIDELFALLHGDDVHNIKIIEMFKNE